jgi:hypothetical protein|tara:strand:+ start:245 stop:697 length:453 start_codon:yes stop_codon:yes gene_type:complete
MIKTKRPLPRVLYDHGKEVALWVGERIKDVLYEFDKCNALGVLDDKGNVMCGVVYHDYRPECGTMQLSIASSNPMWARRETIIELLSYPFISLKLFKCWIVVPSDNKQSLALTKHIGFKQEALLHNQFGKDRHAHFMKMSRKDFKRIYGR